MIASLPQVRVVNKPTSSARLTRQCDHLLDASTPSFFTQPLNPTNFSRLAHRLLIGYCIAAPLSIGLSQTITVSLLAYWCAFIWKHRHEPQVTGFDAFSLGEHHHLPRSFVAAVIAWAIVGLLSSLVGINPVRSVPDTLKTSFFLLLPFSILSSIRALELPPQEVMSRIKLYFGALVVGQTIAALHTLGTAVAGYELQPRPPGPVTESGQLVLVLPCLTALLLIQLATFRSNTVRSTVVFGTALSHVVIAAIVLAALLLTAWPNVIFPSFSSTPIRLSAWIIATALTVLPWLSHRSQTRPESFIGAYRQSSHLLWSAGAFLIMSLVVNLKRGPWAGVVISMSLLGLFVSRKIATTTLVLAALILVLFEPVQTRLFNLVDDFTIGGGRQTLWELGAHLIQRYPLGVGTANSRYVRELDPSLPYTHPHMHNNLLNVLVENGWIGLIVFCSWMYFAIALGFLVWKRLQHSSRLLAVHMRIISLCISCALLGWQLAGVVEYNFGDGEVRLIALLLMGLILGLECATRSMGPNTAESHLNERQKRNVPRRPR